MRYPSLLFVPMLMLSTAASAQSTPPMTARASDQWRSPATATTAANEFRSHAGNDGEASKGHFTFKSSKPPERDSNNQDTPWDEPAPNVNDKTTVMGGSHGWSDGRPPVDCAVTPRDAACH